MLLGVSTSEKRFTRRNFTLLLKLIEEGNPVLRYL